jgi:GrpB-like predicted nucleotidyltransferase (UPF0157 family)
MAYPLHAALADLPVRLRPYDPQWPVRYESERTALAGAIGSWAAGDIHHVGSTAIPGVDAEPVVDILVGIGSLSAPRACIASLARLDYVLGAPRDVDVQSFFKPSTGWRQYELHLMSAEAERYSEMLAFRDFLRTDRQVAIGYVGLKRELADRHADDRHSYTVAKVDLIQTVLAQF